MDDDQLPDSADGTRRQPAGELVPVQAAMAPRLARTVTSTWTFVPPWRRSQPALWRLVLLVWLATLVILLANQPGHIFFDTKLGVDIDPAGFFARLWQLWNPDEWFGTLQDQYIGYGFPMGPFYLVARLIEVPVWVTERLWLALLVAVGFTGMVKLARELGIGTRRSSVVAGLAFALWPTITIVIGSTSAGLLPGLLAPWAVLPLVKAARGGPVVRAAAQSGVAVLCMGGVNATSTLDALVLPALFILVQARGRQLLKLAGCWAGAVVLATSWWVVPLLLQAKYSFDFLPYIEQAATTTGTMSAATFLRGAGNWTAYLSLGQPWLSAGYAMVTYPMAILAGTLAAGTGLLGLTRRDLPYGGWLRLCLGVAALIALAGYPGQFGGLFHSSVDQLLNGALAPLRSVYKVEPAAAAVLALGISHALVLRVRRTAIINDPSHRVLWHLIAAPVIGLVLIGLAFPYLSGKVLNPGSFTAVPQYWYQVSTYIREHAPRTPVLVAPAAAHGTYLWGETVDDPLEPLASSPWVSQGLVPYGGPGSQLLLDSVESAISSGEGTPGLGLTLARSGIRYVVVRNDLNPNALGYSSPQAVHQALASSGFRRVAAFGPLVTGRQTDPGAPELQYVIPAYPAVEVFEATPDISALAAPAVALPVSSTVLVNGGPDALLQLTGQHLLGWQPAVIAGDKLVAKPALWAVTDSLPRADHAFGGTDSTPSYTYTAKGTSPPDDPLGGGDRPPRQLLPVTSAGHQTVAVLTGAASVTASSAGFWLAETPQIFPADAFDRNPGTFWAESSPDSPVGQWIQITFDHPIALPSSIGIELLVDGSLRPVADRLTVTTAAGSVTSRVRRTGAEQPLAVRPGKSRTLRITIAGAHGQVPGGLGAGFTDVDIPGVTVTSYEAPPESAAGRRAVAVAFSFQRTLPSPANLADLSQYPPLARAFDLTSFGTYQLRATAIAAPGRTLDALLARLAPTPRHALEVTASSTLGSLPDLEPQNLFTGGHRGSWIAGGQNPVLRLRWHGKRTVRRMTILPVPGFSAVPESIKITSPNGVRFASIGLDGLTEIVPPLTTQRMSITFPVVQFATTSQQVGGQPVQLPVGLSKLSIPALSGLRAVAPAGAARFALACGSGPRIVLDGHRYPTKVTGIVGDLTKFRQVSIRLCGRGSELGLGAGPHRLRQLAGPGPFTITELSLASVSSGRPGGLSLTAAGGRAVRVRSWGADSRAVQIGAGARSYLEVHQNASPGWTASLNGRPLAPVTLDGWQQGFVVPAGSGGTIRLSFGPVKFYHAWIILSAIGAIALLVIASVRRGRGSVREAMVRALTRPAPASRAVASLTAAPASPAAPVALAAPASPTSPSASAAPALATAAVAPEAALSSVPALSAETGRGPLLAWLGLAGVCVLIAIVGGPVVLAVPVLAVGALWWPNRYGVVAFGCMLASGLLAAMSANPAAAGSATFGGPAQACALVALAAALIPVLPSPLARGWQTGTASPVTGRAVLGRRTAAPGRAASGSGREAFTAADELTCYYDRADEPANVHVEARVAGSLDQGTLRAAVLAVLAAEPGLRVRRIGTGWWRHFSWESAESGEVLADMVSVEPYRDDDELASLRSAFISRSPALNDAPPLRVLLAFGPAGDVLVLNAHHARFDGLACLRLLRSVASEYCRLAGPEHPQPAEPPPASAGVPGPAGMPDHAGVPGLAGGSEAAPGLRGRARARRVTRIAAVAEPASPAGRRDGYGLHQVSWPGLGVAAGLRRTGSTVNDLLIAAMISTVSDWNADRGARSGLIKITMPVGDRTQLGAAGEWANRSRLTTVTALRGGGESEAGLLADVTSQTRYAKEHPGPQVGLVSQMIAWAPLPTAIKQLVVRVTMRGAGAFLADTSLVSNLGVIEPIAFGVAQTASVWFSTSAHMPRGLSLGAVTCGDSLRLTFRYRRALFTAAAAAQFAQEYVRSLDRLTGLNLVTGRGAP